MAQFSRRHVLGFGAGALSLLRSGPLRAAFQGAADRLAIVRPGGRAWREERLTVAGRLEGETGADGARRFRGGSLQLASGEDRLELALPDDLRPDAARPVWPVRSTCSIVCSSRSVSSSITP